MYEEIVFKREELYEQIWSEPIIKLAQQYSLSDVGLAKMCKKLKIPLPGRGYWQKGVTDRLPLPPLKIGDPTTYTLRREQRDILPIDEAHEAPAAELIDQEQLPANKIRVPLRLSSPHPLVVRTQFSLEAAKPDNYGRVFPWSDTKSFYVSITSQSVHRAMLILDALLKAFDSRGFSLTTKEDNRNRTTYVTVLGQTIEISIEEPTNQVEHKLTPAEQKEQIKHPWRTFEKYEHKASGRLVLAIKNVYWGNIRHKWSDGSKQKLEDCLNDFMVGLIRASSVLRSVELQRERRAQERRDQELQRIEMEAKIKEEQERFETLIEAVDNWHTSNRIRQYIEAVRNKAIREHGVVATGSDLEEWIIWAAKQADRLDPFVK